jgi:cysteine-rich repeat protein
MTHRRLARSLFIVVPMSAACFAPHDPIVVTASDSDANDSGSGETMGSMSEPTTATMSSTTEPTGSTDPTASTTMSSTTDTADSSGTDTDPSDSGSTDDGGPLCGNNMLDGDEACDDGNEVNGDGCNNDCIESGTLLWEVVLPNNGNESVSDVAVGDADGVALLWYAGGGPHIDTFDSDGAALDSLDLPAGGSWHSLDVFANGDFAVSFAADVAIQVARISAAGDELWSSTASGSGAPNFYPADIVTTDDDDVAFGGTANAAIWAGKFDGGGPFDWSDVFSVAAPGWGYGHGIACEADGTCVVAGITDANGSSTGGKEFWLRRLSPGGTAIWTRTHPVDGYSETAVVASSPTGDVALAACDDTGCFGLGYTSDGDPKPAFVYDDLYPFGLASDVDGNFVLVGSGQRDDASEGANGIVKKFDADGNELWTRSYNSSGVQDDEALRVATDSLGRIVVAGSTEQSEGDGSNDAWIRAYTP